MYATTLKELKLDDYSKIGYTYKTMGAGFWALKQKEFRPALQAIVMAVSKHYVQYDLSISKSHKPYIPVHTIQR